MNTNAVLIYHHRIRFVKYFMCRRYSLLLIYLPIAIYILYIRSYNKHKESIKIDEKLFYIRRFGDVNYKQKYKYENASKGLKQDILLEKL